MKLIKSNITKTPPDGKLPVQPSAIHRALDGKLSGLSEAKRFISTRIALHLRRAVDLAKGNPTPDKNQCILILGPSGSGKTFLVEQAAAAAKIPFIAASSASLTSEGYWGQSLSDVLNLLRKSTPNPKLARYGICFLDEWDKRVQQNFEKSGFSMGVQGEILRMMEGTDVEIQDRSSPSKPSAKFNTRGLMFVFAGAFDGLERLMDQKVARHVTGFAPGGEASLQPLQEGYLRDALVEYGIMPEFMNRLSGILQLPSPTADDMLALLKFGSGPVEACNQRLRGLGTEIVLAENTAGELAKFACITKSYCRGMQLLLQAAADHLVYEGITGQVALEPEDLKQLAAGKWLETGQPGKGKGLVEPTGEQPRLMTVGA